MSADPADTATSDQSPSSQGQRIRKRLNTALRTLATCLIVVGLAPLPFFDGDPDKWPLSWLAIVGCLLITPGWLVSLLRQIRSTPLPGWIRRLGVAGTYTFFLGWMGVCLIGLLLGLGIPIDALTIRSFWTLDFLTYLFLVTSIFALGFIALVVFAIAFTIKSGMQWERKAHAQEPRLR